MKPLGTLAILILVCAQNAAADDSILGGASGLVPIQLTRMQGDPAIGVHMHTLPGEKPGDKDGFMRYMALVYLKEHPEILEHEKGALGVAKLFLTSEAQSRLMNNVGRFPATEYVWNGDNEFQVERTRRAFLDEYGPTLAKSAPQPPFEFWVVSPAGIGHYDFGRGGYDIYGPKIVEPFYISPVAPTLARSLSDDLSLKHNMLYVNTSNEVHVPKFMPMTADRAEELTNFLAVQDDENKIYFSAHMRVLATTQTYDQQRYMKNRTITKFVGGIFNIEIVSLALYADSELSRLIHQYDAPTPIKAK